MAVQQNTYEKRSAQAKNKINQWFRSITKDENIQKGQELLAENAKNKGIDLGLINKPKYQERVLRRYGFHDWNSVLAAIGQGSLKEGAVINRMEDGYKKDHPITMTDEDVLAAHNPDAPVDKDHPQQVPQARKKSKNGIVVKGLYDVSVRFSKCCNPVPGDEIVGFVTRGRGVSIHRTDCINIINMPDSEKSRLIEAEWQPDFIDAKEDEEFLAEIHIYGQNRTGLLVDVTKVFTEHEIDIRSIHSKTSKQGVATIDLSFMTKNREEISEICDRLKQIESVIDVQRASGR